MSSTMALRCLLRRIPARHLPRVRRGVPAPPPASRPMTTISQDELRRAVEMNEKFMESMKVRHEASTREGMKMEKKCNEAIEAAARGVDAYVKAVDNLKKVSHKIRVAVAGFTGFLLLSSVGIDYYYFTSKHPLP